MGGKGSGRPPKPETIIARTRYQQQTPIASRGSEGFFLPNHSGISTHPEAKAAFGHWTKNGNDLYPTDTSDYVGIGTTNPAYPFHIVSATSSGMVFQCTGANTSPVVILQNDAQSWQLKNNGAASDAFQLLSGSTAKLNVSTTGDFDFQAGNITTSGDIESTKDHDTNDTLYMAQVLHGTDATPPTASGFPRGTIYIQYTA